MASNTSVSNIALTGGLNVTSSDQMLADGECMELKNYEITSIGRYRRVKGYERFSGESPPSQVVASSLPGFPFATIDELIDAVLAEQLSKRNAIEQVPGAGAVLGVFGFDGEIFAFRNTEDESEAKMHKATFGGWVAVSTPTLEPNGYYEVREANFTGSVGTREIIGVDGKNPAFRFDGTTFTQITTDVLPDAPTHLEVLPSQILLLSFRGGSFLYSGVGEPTKYSPVDGGGEIAVGHEITGMEVQADSTVAIFTRNRTFMLYGSSPVDFQLKVLALRSGALEKTIQSMGSTMYLDDRGLTRLDRVQQFGDFEGATISQKVQTLLTQRLLNVRCSMVLREKNQYRLFFSDNTALTLTQYGSEVLGFTQLQLTFTPYCAWSGENTEGKESYFIGGEDGYVYQMESGNSFDSYSYASSFQTGFVNNGSPEYKKRWRKLVLEAQSVTTLEAQYKCYYDYADPNIPLSDTMIGSGAKWDLSLWDDAIWGGASTSWSDLYIDGVSRSISVYMRTESNYYPPHELSLLMLHASPRGRRR
jgi:hypothetical protein